MSDKAEIEKIRARMRRYADRLEITSHYISTRDGPLEQVEVPEAEWDNQIDGIECRNETIRLQDENINRLRAALDAATAERREWALRLVEFAVVNAERGMDYETLLAAFEEQEKARG